jgi:hypothetical protein
MIPGLPLPLSEQHLIAQEKHLKVSTGLGDDADAVAGLDGVATTEGHNDSSTDPRVSLQVGAQLTSDG